MSRLSSPRRLRKADVLVLFMRIRLSLCCTSGWSMTCTSPGIGVLSCIGCEEMPISTSPCAPTPWFCVHTRGRLAIHSRLSVMGDGPPGSGMREPGAGLRGIRRLVIGHRAQGRADRGPVMGEVGVHHGGDAGDLEVD